jgi:hypothetical protein
MFTATNQSQQPPATQPSGTDPVLLLVLGIVFVLVLGATLYLRTGACPGSGRSTPRASSGRV